MTSALLTPPTVTRTAPVAGPFRFTREQYHHMGELGFFEGKRVELIRGEISLNGPVTWSHVKSKCQTSETLKAIFHGTNLILDQSPVVTDDSEPEPDVAVYRGKLRDYFAHPTPADTLLVVEVAVTSFVKDTTVKALFYAQEGIADYWVVDVEHRKLLVFREPSATGYQSKSTLADTESISPPRRADGRGPRRRFAPLNLAVPHQFMPRRAPAARIAMRLKLYTPAPSPRMIRSHSATPGQRF